MAVRTGSNLGPRERTTDATIMLVTELPSCFPMRSILPCQHSVAVRVTVGITAQR